LVFAENDLSYGVFNMPILFLLYVGIAISSSPKVYWSEGQAFIVERVVEREDCIWGFDFLPDGKLIFSERNGKLLTFDEKTKVTRVIEGLPKVHAVGQGGLLDVKVHPDFKSNQLIFFTYAEPKDGKSTTALMRAKLIDSVLQEQKQLFSAHKPNGNDIHYGSRIVLDGSGNLYFAVGDRNDRQKVQDKRYHIGKLLRIKEDGSIPKDNPFVKEKNAQPEIWSLGHRSPQGLTLHPETKELWEAEMGPRGGDEVNIIEKGKNYGWPEVTRGREYYGPKIGVADKFDRENPIVYWTPSISPSGIDFYFQDKFPKWKGSLFLANLSGQHLRRLSLKGRSIVAQEELLKDLGSRFRHVRSGPDGFLYASTDEGLIIRLKPR
jgi:aldose sugar dehydrogenase